MGHLVDTRIPTYCNPGENACMQQKIFVFGFCAHVYVYAQIFRDFFLVVHTYYFGLSTADMEKVESLPPAYLQFQN